MGYKLKTPNQLKYINIEKTQFPSYKNRKDDFLCILLVDLRTGDFTEFYNVKCKSLKSISIKNGPLLEP